MNLSTSLSDRRNNNLNLVRLILAGIVVLGHAGQIFSLGINFNVLRIPAVGLFFFLSGLLISRSVEHSSSLKSYFLKRFVRIFPAAWFSIILTLFILAPFHLSCSLSDYLASGETWTAFLKNSSLLKLEHAHSCIYPNSVLPSEINGSLWSLPYELMAYVAIVPLFLLGLLKKKLDRSYALRN